MAKSASKKTTSSGKKEKVSQHNQTPVPTQKGYFDPDDIEFNVDTLEFGDFKKPEMGPNDDPDDYMKRASTMIPIYHHTS